VITGCGSVDRNLVNFILVINRFLVNALLGWIPMESDRHRSPRRRGVLAMVTGSRSATPAHAATPPRPSLLYVVKQLELAVRSRLDEMLKSSGITALQYTALTVLDHHEGLSPARLARHSFVTPQSIADLIANLERRKLVRRERNPHNRRELVVSLTGTGRELLARYETVVQEIERDMTARLGAAEAEQLRGMLDACRLQLTEPAD
jgi:DNA-binding MarR family transcriptional regulator